MSEQERIKAYGEAVISGTPSYCWDREEDDGDAHCFHASIHLNEFVHGPATIAILVAACAEGDEIGIELSEPELRLIRDRIDQILTSS